MRVVVRILRGESKEALSEELKVSPDRIEAWESTFLDAGRKALSNRKGRLRHGKLAAWIATWSALLMVLLAAVYFLTRLMERTGE